jgi:N-acetyl-gamma-glutamyl-phosphate reductase
MTKTIFIDGQAGTTGLGIARRLDTVPDIALRQLGDADRKNPEIRLAAMRDADLVILCLPDDAAREAVALAETLGAAAAKILDASTAHRTDPAWTYGFAELTPAQPAAIAAATRVANPGCYATAAIALLHPLVANGLIPPNTPLTITAVSGYSGGGKAMIADHEGAGGPAFELYALAHPHKHLPEIIAHAGLARPPIFLPSVAHLPQGMLLSIPLHLDQLAPGATVAILHDALAAWYAAGQVRVLPPTPDGRQHPHTLADSDAMELRVYGNDAHAVLVASLDNLGKGASGAAVQNARLMLGLPA